MSIININVYGKVVSNENLLHELFPTRNFCDLRYMYMYNIMYTYVLCF